MNSPQQSECMVTGPLYLMLRMSQLAGVAPLSFRRTQGGWCFRASRAANCYGRALSFVLWLLSVTTIAMDILIEPERSFRTHTNSGCFVWAADVCTVCLVMCTAAFTGLTRMKSLIIYLTMLQEVNFKLCFYGKKPINETTQLLIAISSIIYTNATNFLNYGMFISRVVNSQGKVVTSSMYIFHYIAMSIQQVILVTFFEIATTVLSTLRTLNKCLKDLLQEMLNESTDSNNHESRIDMYKDISKKSINSVIDTIAIHRCIGQTRTPPKIIIHTVRRLALLYCSICDVIRLVNESHGTVLVALLLCLLLHLVIIPYHFITNIFNELRSDRSNPLLQLNLVVLHFSNLLLIIEPCQRTHDELEMTRHLIGQMLRETPPEQNALLSELQMFYRHLNLNEVSYAPLKMFSLNRALIVTILGSITTYLVMLIQLK